MIFKKSQASGFQIPGGTNGFIYPSANKNQTVACVEMDGVYPEKGYSVNDTCTETLLVLDGSFKIELDGKSFDISKDDLVTILPETKYRIKGCGKVVDLMTPAWDGAQNHIVK